MRRWAVAALAAHLITSSAAALAPAPSVSAAAAPLARAERGGYLMGLAGTVTADARDTVSAMRAVEAAFDGIARAERALSRQGDGELARMNATAAKQPFVCTDEMFGVMAGTLAVAERTGGTFDPTVDPLVTLWDLRSHGRVPKDAQLERTLRAVGWRHVTLDSSARTVSFAARGVGIDLDGVSRGHGLDRAVEAMKRAGAPRGLVNLGSEVGSFTDGPEWTVSIPHPADPQRPALRLPIGNAALSTASQSQRWFVFAGVRYGHIIDPRTGRPVATSAAVTTIAPSGFEADALSSALLVMGRADAQAFAQRNRQIGVVWLEPSEHELLAWRWNVPKVEPVPGVALRWMDGAGEAPVSPRQ